MMNPKRETFNPGALSPDAASLSERLATLSELSLPELRSEWRRLYRSQAPRLSRKLMVRALGHRIQERACGRLTPAISRRLQEYGQKNAEAPDGRDLTTTIPKPGTRLVREWNSRTYTVTVTEDGFTFNNKNYRSLTGIARAITGAHWSGPRFFGLNTRTGNGGGDGKRDA
jgi:hypothetical protein